MTNLLQIQKAYVNFRKVHEVNNEGIIDNDRNIAHKTPYIHGFSPYLSSGDIIKGRPSNPVLRVKEIFQLVNLCEFFQPSFKSHYLHCLMHIPHCS